MSANRELEPEVIAALNNGQKIRAIKILRDSRNIGLKQAKELVEQYDGSDGSASSSRSKQGDSDISENRELEPEVIEALTAGQKITAIKILRDSRNIGLKQAKELVEQYDGTESNASISRSNQGNAVVIVKSNNTIVLVVFIVVALFLIYQFL